jgi:hypothetical protein
MIRDVYPGSDPGSGFFSIPDPGSRSATLDSLLRSEDPDPDPYHEERMFMDPDPVHTVDIPRPRPSRAVVKPRTTAPASSCNKT